LFLLKVITKPRTTREVQSLLMNIGEQSKMYTISDNNTKRRAQLTKLHKEFGYKETLGVLTEHKNGLKKRNPEWAKKASSDIVWLKGRYSKRRK
jgi:hypothetical protein